MAKLNPTPCMGRAINKRIPVQYVMTLLKLMLGIMITVLAVGCAENAHERNNAGNEYMRNEAYQEAVRAYQLAQVNAPDHAIPYYNAGIALTFIQDLEAAALALEQALKTDDETLIKQAYYNLGNVYFMDGRYFDAVDAFQQVLLRDPDDQDARYNYELALLYAIPPTPSDQQQQTQPESDEVDPNTTPTNQPNAMTGPTPTPPRQDNPPENSATPEGGNGDFFHPTPSTLVPQQSGQMTIEDAERLLDVIEQNQRSLSEFLNDGVTSGNPDENDW
ncbi:MAG: tetratricopeptide repeat protein [Anaerolineae bacterium]|nr:tetratricopeptide repeat protein [Anaerolineae bacterium]